MLVIEYIATLVSMGSDNYFTTAGRALAGIGHSVERWVGRDGILTSLNEE